MNVFVILRNDGEVMAVYSSEKEANIDAGHRRKESPGRNYIVQKWAVVDEWKYIAPVEAE